MVRTPLLPKTNILTWTSFTDEMQMNCKTDFKSKIIKTLAMSIKFQE